MNAKKSRGAKPNTYRVLAPFRYELNGAIQWLTPDNTTEIQLPKHVAQDLIRQNKIEVI